MLGLNQSGYKKPLSVCRNPYMLKYDNDFAYLEAFNAIIIFCLSNKILEMYQSKQSLLYYSANQMQSLRIDGNYLSIGKKNVIDHTYFTIKECSKLD
jgi:hypothetical protein